MLTDAQKAEREARFLAFVEMVPESGCWLWNGGLNSGGYGNFWWNKKTVAAHRFAYEIFIGQIPNGLSIDHLCRVKCCVNPYHLEATTIRTNILRSDGQAAINARRLICAKGHSLAPDNVYIWIGNGYPYGKRKCRECIRIALRSYRRKRKNREALT